MSPKRPHISHEDAETLAIEAFGFLASDESRLIPFLKATGLDLPTIRKAAGTVEFLTGVLDFLMSDESLLLVFAAHRRLDPNLIALARQTLAPKSGKEF